MASAEVSAVIVLPLLLRFVFGCYAAVVVSLAVRLASEGGRLGPEELRIVKDGVP